MNSPPAAQAQICLVEEYFLKHLIAVQRRIVEPLREVRFVEMHDVLAAARCRPDENHLPEDGWSTADHVLRYHSAERVSQHVARGNVQSIEKRQCVLRHGADGVRHAAIRAANSCAVEENEVVFDREGVGYGRVPVVQVSHKMLEAQQRQAARLSKPAIGVFRALRVDELRGCGDVAGSR